MLHFRIYRIYALAVIVGKVYLWQRDAVCGRMTVGQLPDLLPVLRLCRELVARYGRKEGVISARDKNIGSAKRHFNLHSVSSVWGEMLPVNALLIIALMVTANCYARMNNIGVTAKIAYYDIKKYRRSRSVRRYGLPHDRTERPNYCCLPSASFLITG